MDATRGGTRSGRSVLVDDSERGGCYLEWRAHLEEWKIEKKWSDCVWKRLVLFKLRRETGRVSKEMRSQDMLEIGKGT